MTKVIAFGDSIMKGVVMKKSQNQKETKYTVSESNFSNEVERRLGFEVVNYGKFGSTIENGAKVIDRNLDKIQNADYALLEYGGNDCDFHWAEIANNPTSEHNPKTSLKEFVRRYCEVIEKIKSMGTKPLLLSLPPLCAERYFDYFSKDLSGDERNRILNWLGGNKQRISNWHQSYNLELFKIAMNEQIPIIDITTSFLQKVDLFDYICMDGIHPNDKGQKLIGEILCEKFEKN